MTFFTIISLVIALFGASQAMMSSIRSHSEADLRKKVEDSISRCDYTMSALDGCSNTTDLKGKLETQRTSAESALRSWRAALISPTYAFTVVVAVLFFFIEFVAWTGEDGKVRDFPSWSIIYVKVFLAIYAGILVFAAFCLRTNRSEFRIANENLNNLFALANAISNRKNTAQVEPPPAAA